MIGLCLLVMLCVGLVGFMLIGLVHDMMDEPESLILAQSERWRHA